MYLLVQFICITLVGFFNPDVCTAQAAHAPPEPLSIHKAFSLALDHNPALQASSADATAARAAVESARSNFLPRLDIRQSYVRSDNPVQVFSDKLAQQNFKSSDFQIRRLNYPSLHTNLRTQFVLTQPLFNRGAEFVDFKIAQYYECMSTAAQEQTRQKVLLEVVKAYLAWLLSFDTHAVITKSVATAEENLAIATARFRTGSALKSDVLQAEVHCAQMRKEAVATNNAIALACADVNVVMGIPPDRQWQQQPFNPAAVPQSKDLDDWTTLALGNRPECTYMRAFKEMAHMVVKKQTMHFLPALNFTSIYENNAEGTRGIQGNNFTVLITADFNILRGLGDVAELKKAKAQEQKARALAQDVEQTIRSDVYTAWHNLLTAREQVKVTQQAVQQAEESLRIVQQRYTHGLTIITELLNTHDALNAARLQHLQAVYDERFADAQLAWAAGMLPEQIRNW